MANHPDRTNLLDVESTIQQEPLPPLLHKQGGPVFANSWEAEAYAIGNILVKQGVVSCKEWMDRMAEAIREAQQAGDADTGETYYLHWCRALEGLCIERGMISKEAYQELLDRWQLAIANTPHGVALSLENAEAKPQAQAHHTHDHQHHQHHQHHDHAHAWHEHGPSEPPPEHFWKPIHVTELKPPRSEA